VDRLLERGIEPVLTLYHWDLPQALEDRGGWPHRDTAYRFTDYTELVGEALGDRVRHWTTINEPWCAAMLGYASGSHAPGRTEPAAALRAAHHLLLAHGLGMDVLRGTVRKDAELGITVNLYPVSTDGRREADGEAVRRIDGLMNRSYLDPVLLGHYPADVLADLEEVTDFAHVRDGDLPRIAQPIDALGVNYYRPHRVRYARTQSASPSPWPGSPDVAFDPPVRTPPTANGWAVEPDGLREVLVRLVREYPRVPLYVHECGAAFEDRMGPDGHIDDRERIAFVDAHLRAAHDGLKGGADLRGYFVWSLLDNFEWAEGYTYRFGLVHVDFATQRRTPKASARWFKGVAAANALDTEPAW
jgi:beta-glucosidase